MMIKRKTIAAVLPLAALFLIFLAQQSAWAAGSTDGVVAALLKKYTLTQTTGDKSQITQDGTTLAMKQAGVYTVAWDRLIQLDNKVTDGKVQQQPWLIRNGAGKLAHVLQTGEKVYVTKIESKTDGGNSVLKFSILTVDQIDSDGAQKRYQATVTFKFAKGYLDQTPPEEVEQAVEAVMAPAEDSDNSQQATDSKGGQQAQAAPPAQASAPPPPPAPAGPPPSISIGESSSQVLQSLGMPKQIIDLGKKKTYIYKDMKLVFVDDKVTDMQPL